MHLEICYTFTWIVAALLPSRTYEYVWYVFNVTSRSIHGLANGIIDHRHSYFLQNTRQWAIFIETSPASNKRCLSNKVFIVFGHTNWYYVWLEYHRFVESWKEIILFHIRFQIVFRFKEKFTVIRPSHIQKFWDRIVDAKLQFVPAFPGSRRALPLPPNHIHPNAAEDQMAGRWNVKKIKL